MNLSVSFLIAKKCARVLEFSVSDNRKHINLSLVKKKIPKWKWQQESVMCIAASWALNGSKNHLILPM